ncbi:MAG: peptide deformylase [Calditerrivibrio sp.]|nr:peptide deformylase [Calditerrivibrio sp.]
MILEIKKFPDQVLRKKALEVESFDNSLRELVENMAETMYSAPGVGLAAPQVGVSKRLFIIDISEKKDNLNVFINPVIVNAEGEILEEEGCLSLPGEYANVIRSREVEVLAYDLEGKQFSLKADGLMSRAIQHELDHLNGTLFIDKLPIFKREAIKKSIKKRKELGEY